MCNTQQRDVDNITKLQMIDAVKNQFSKKYLICVRNKSNLVPRVS
jgi:hypothetical protein